MRSSSSSSILLNGFGSVSVLLTVLLNICQLVHSNYTNEQDESGWWWWWWFNILIEKGPSLVPLCALIHALIHGFSNFGRKGMIVYSIIVFVIANIYENLSIASGFPFGFYHYTDKLLGPKIIYTPILVNVAYFHMTYLVWIITGVILDQYQSKLRGSMIVIYPMTATFIMVMWDLVMDPYMSTIVNNWVWHQGGSFFGVPLQNYAGWFLCVYSMFQLFAIWLHYNGKCEIQPILQKKMEWFKCVIVYLHTPMFFFILSITEKNQLIKSNDGRHGWNSLDIVKSGFLVSVCTMVFIAFLVIVKTIILERIPIHTEISKKL